MRQEAGSRARALGVCRAGDDRARRAADARASSPSSNGSSAPTATRILGRLAEEGLVDADRRPDATAAARSSPLTADGRALLKRLRSRKNAYLARRMRELPDDDVATLERAAEILERVLEEERA